MSHVNVGTFGPDIPSRASSASPAAFPQTPTIFQKRLKTTCWSGESFRSMNRGEGIPNVHSALPLSSPVMNCSRPCFCDNIAQCTVVTQNGCRLSRATLVKAKLWKIQCVWRSFFRLNCVFVPSRKFLKKYTHLKHGGDVQLQTMPRVNDGCHKKKSTLGWLGIHSEESR